MRKHVEVVFAPPGLFGASKIKGGAWWRRVVERLDAIAPQTESVVLFDRNRGGSIPPNLRERYGLDERGVRR